MDKVLQRAAIQENEINGKRKAASVGVKIGSDGLGLIRLHKAGSYLTRSATTSHHISRAEIRVEERTLAALPDHKHRSSPD